MGGVGMDLAIYRPDWTPPPSLGGSSPSGSKSSPAAQDNGQSSRSSANQDRVTSGNKGDSGPQLSRQERELLQQLRQRDREVRQHEQAHMSAGGEYTRGAQFQYEKGPRGQLWAVGGEVSFDSSRPEEPKKAMEKGETLARAALAPAEPSQQDLKVASTARQMAAEARAELQRQGGSVEGDSTEGDAAYRRWADNGESGSGSGQALDRVV